MTRVFYFCVFVCLQISLLSAQSTAYTKYFGGAVDWWPESVSTDANGRLYTAINEDAGNVEKVILTCTDSLGNIVWSKKWGNDQELIRPEKMVTLPTGQIMSIGTYYNPIGGGSDGIFLVMQPDGTPLGQFILRSLNYETVRDLKVAPNGNFYILGEIESGNGYGSFLVEMAPTGQLVKSRVLTKGLYTYYNSLQVNADGVYISGVDNPGNGNPNTALLSRLDHNFNLLWTVQMSASNADVRGYDILPILPNGNTRQMVWNNGQLYLVERDSGGQFMDEHWIAYSEPLGFAEAGNNYVATTTSGELVVLDKNSGALSAQVSWAGSSSNPVVLPGNCVFALGYEAVNGTIQTVFVKGASNEAPGCAGYYNLYSGPASSALNSSFVQPVIANNSSLAVLPANLSLVNNSNSVLNPGCSVSCAYAPVPAFTYSVDELTINFAADTIDDDATYDWTLSNGSSTGGGGGSFTVSSAGIYQLCLDVEGPCGKSRLCKDIEIILEPVFEKMNAVPLEVVPNPTDKHLRLSGLAPGEYHCTVTNILGERVWEANGYMDHSTVFDVASWQGGQQYFLTLYNGSRIYTARIFKK